MHRFIIIQYVCITRAYSIASILFVLERTISCKLTVRALTSGHHNQQQYRGDGLRKRGYFLVLCSAVQTVSIVEYSTLSYPHYQYCFSSVDKYLDAALMYQVCNQIKDELSELTRKMSGMAKNNHSRVQGFNTFHLVQSNNYDL